MLLTVHLSLSSEDLFNSVEGAAFYNKNLYTSPSSDTKHLLEIR